MDETRRNDSTELEEVNGDYELQFTSISAASSWTTRLPSEPSIKMEDPLPSILEEFYPKRIPSEQLHQISFFPGIPFSLKPPPGPLPATQFMKNQANSHTHCHPPSPHPSFSGTLLIHAPTPHIQPSIPKLLKSSSRRK